MSKQKIYPFVKWAGGKSWLIKDLDSYLPAEFKNNKIERYVEPFVGGGALLFHVLSNYDIKEVFIHDNNKELLNTYEAIKTSLDDLIKALENIENEYKLLSIDDRKEYFYNKRVHFNNGILNGYNYPDVNMAAKFIFLNKTCFNGLYRGITTS